MWLRRRLADYFIVKASRHPVDQAQPATKLWVDGPSGKIECFAARKPSGQQEPRPLKPTDPPADLLILKLPGTAGRAERSTTFPASLLTDLDVEVWTWNPPGYGGSQGVASLQTMPAAVVSTWDHLCKRRCTSVTKTMVAGNSLGCVTALHLASQRSVGSLMLRNPPPLVPMVQAGNAWWNAQQGGSWLAEAIDDSMNAILTAGQCNCPALFVQSACDHLVTPDFQAKIIEAYRGPKEVTRIADADHDTPYVEADFPALRRGIQWLIQTCSE